MRQKCFEASKVHLSKSAPRISICNEVLAFAPTSATNTKVKKAKPAKKEAKPAKTGTTVAPTPTPRPESAPEVRKVTSGTKASGKERNYGF